MGAQLVLDPLVGICGHGTFKDNGQTVNGTFTFNARGTLSDGSTFSNHRIEHFNQRPDGTVHEFFHCH